MPPIAVIFDVDGVLVASPHERAWQEALASLMATEWREVATVRGYAPGRFTTAVYQQHVAGKPRLSGARAVLDYFDLPDAESRAQVYAARKQQRIEALIDQGAFEAFSDALRLVLALRARGVRLAAASSSKNADRFMEQVRLDTFARQAGIRVPPVAAGETLRDSFGVDVCGRDLPQGGKPHPGLFLMAAAELGLPPACCVVVEDAPAGIQAARAGGMVALGVARHEDAALLQAAGADLVVASLDEVAVDALAAGRLARAVDAGGTALADIGRRTE